MIPSRETLLALREKHRFSPRILEIVTRPSALTRKDPGLLGKNDPLDLSAPDPKAEWTQTVNIADLACAKRLLVLLDGNLDTRSVSLRVKWRNFWRAPSVARLRRG